MNNSNRFSRRNPNFSFGEEMASGGSSRLRVENGVEKVEDRQPG